MGKLKEWLHDRESESSTILAALITHKCPYCGGLTIFKSGHDDCAEVSQQAEQAPPGSPRAAPLDSDVTRAEQSPLGSPRAAHPEKQRSLTSFKRTNP